MASILFCGKSCRNENNYAILHNAILHNPSINNCMKALLEGRLHLRNTKKKGFFFGISLDLHYL